MRRQSVIIIIIMLTGISLQIFGQTNETVEIFLVSFFPGDIDIRLRNSEVDFFFDRHTGNSNKSINFYGIKENAVHRIQENQISGDFLIDWRYTGDNEWISYSKTIITDNSTRFDTITYDEVTLKRGNTYAVIVDAKGDIKVKNVSGADNTMSPKICFINGSLNRISRMEISPHWKSETNRLYIENFSNNSKNITAFASIVEGSYSYFWQPENVNSQDYYYYTDEAGNPVKIYLYNNNYYVFIIFTNSENIAVGQIYNISP